MASKPSPLPPAVSFYAYYAPAKNQRLNSAPAFPRSSELLFFCILRELLDIPSLALNVWLRKFFAGRGGEGGGYAISRVTQNTLFPLVLGPLNYYALLLLVLLLAVFLSLPTMLSLSAPT